MRANPVLAILVAAGILGALCRSTASGGEFAGDYSKLSGIIIPGFASTQLRAWSILDCPYSPLDFNPLDLVWLDTTKLLSAVNCWLKCMFLDPYNQTDHPDCKSRPDSGLSAITELDPGYITGPLSSVWKEWIKWCIEFGIEPNAIIAAPYDWRLSPSMMEERDLYFHRLKFTFETAFKLRGGPSLVFAHSLGNHVFRYFLEWLKLEIAPKHYHEWLDKHIHAYFAVGSPLLGSLETLKAALFGNTFGLPLSEGTARLMFNSFASSLWMMPFSKYCRAHNPYWKHFIGGSRKVHHIYQCEEQEDYSGWPTNVVNIEIPSTRGADAYPSVTDVAQANLSIMECGLPIQLSFSAREVSDGTLFKAIEDYDPDSKKILHQLQKSYHGDPVLNPLTPWDRPPIKNVFCIYGIHRRTEEEEKGTAGDYTKDRTVDIKGRPILRSKTGTWKACSFIVAYEIFERMAFHGIVTNLFTYLTTKLQEGAVKASNNVTNWAGTVWILSLTNTGMGLLTLAVSVHDLTPPSCHGGYYCKDGSNFQKGVSFSALYIVAAGTGGTKPNVSMFGVDQFDDFEPKERMYKLSFFNWWFFAIFLCTLFSNTVLVCLQDNVGWTLGYGLPTLGIAVSIVIFLVGSPFYRQKPISGSPLAEMALVLVAASRKWNIPVPSDPKELHELSIEEYSKSSELRIDQTPSLRFLTKLL